MLAVAAALVAVFVVGIIDGHEPALAASKAGRVVDATEAHPPLFSEAVLVFDGAHKVEPLDAALNDASRRLRDAAFNLDVKRAVPFDGEGEQLWRDESFPLLLPWWDHWKVHVGHKEEIRSHGDDGIAISAIPDNQAGLERIAGSKWGVVRLKDTDTPNFYGRPVLGIILQPLNSVLPLGQIGLSSGEQELFVRKFVLLLRQGTSQLQLSDLVARAPSEIVSRDGEPIGGAEQESGGNRHDNTGERSHKPVVIVKPDEKSSDDGRYNIVVGAVIWGAILALAAYLPKLYFACVDKPKINYRRNRK